MSRCSAVELVFTADPKALGRAFEDARILARLEYLPADGAAVPVTAKILVVDDGAICTLTGAGVQPGPKARHIIHAIATRLGAPLWVPAWDLDVQPAAGGEGPGPAPGGETTIVAVTGAPLSAIPMYAAAVQCDLSVLDLGDRRCVMSHSSDGPVGFGHFGWSEDTLPALVLVNDAGERTVQLHTRAGALPDAMHSWDLVTAIAPAEAAADPAARELIAEHFEARTDADTFADYARVPAEQMRAAMAMPATEGIAGMLRLFALPPQLGEVLSGEVRPSDVPGAQTYPHDSVGGAIRDAVKLYVGEQFPAGGGADEFWVAYGNSWANHPRLRLALAAGEATLAALLIGSASRSGGRVRGTFGALFLADAVANAALPRLLARLVRERR